MKRLTLLGSAPNTWRLWEEYRTHELWTLAYMYERGVPATRLFELHLPGDIPAKRWAVCQRVKDLPIYMLDRYPEIPNSTPYPLDHIFGQIFGRVWHGAAPTRFAYSSLDYMLAMAVVQEFTHINIIGFDMSSTSAYYYERPGAHFFLGYAAAKGIELFVPEPAQLLGRKMYGYESYPKAGPAVMERLEFVRQTMEWE